MSDRGSASVVAAAMLTVLVLFAGVGVAVGSAVIGRHRAQAAADLAALAGAGRVALGGQAACAAATSIATSMGAAVVECTLNRLDVVVAVEMSVDLGRWGLGQVRGAARAGPGDPGG